MRSKVLFISHDATRTGAPIVFLHILRWFRKHTDIPMQILLRNGGPLEEEFKALAPTRVLHWDNPHFDQAEKQKYLRELAKQDFRLIYSNTIMNGQILELLAEADCPIVSHVHELEYRIKHQTPSEIIAGMTACTDYYVAVSQAVKDNLVECLGIPDSRIEIIHECVPTQVNAADLKTSKEIRNELGIPENSPVVGACGTSDWRKGPDLFLQLAVQVRRLYGGDVHFCWLGAQVEARDFSALEYDVRRANLDGRVHFVGSKDNPEDYFSIFDVFASTSREDPFPLVNLEAAAYGVPVICFDNSGGGKEFVKHECGFVVPYLDMAEMGSRVVELLKNPELRLKLGNQARESVRKDFDISVVPPKVFNLIRSVGSKWTKQTRETRKCRVSLMRNPAGSLSDLFKVVSDPVLSRERYAIHTRQLGMELGKAGFFQDVYNLASWLDLKREKTGAVELYKTVTRYAFEADPEMAGKALFKMGCYAETDDEAAEHFRKCLEKYPAHRAARERLDALSAKRPNDPGRKQVISV